MLKKANYPILSVFVDEVYNISKENYEGEENVDLNTSLSILTYPKILPETIDKALDLANDLIEYFTPSLLLHHHQDEVPLLSIYLGVDENHVNINTHGGYYSKFIRSIPELQNQLDGLLLMIQEDLNIDRNNIDDIISDLQDMPRLDIKNNLDIKNDDENYSENSSNSENLNWNYTRIIRTPYSEAYALYLNNESAGQIHIHIGKNIDATIISTLYITEKEKAELMVFVHETLLEALEEDYKTNSTITFYNEAIEEV